MGKEAVSTAEVMAAVAVVVTTVETTDVAVVLTGLKEQQEYKTEQSNMQLEFYINSNIYRSVLPKLGIT